MQRMLGCLALALCLGGCGKRVTPVEQAAARGELLVGLGAEPQDLDPQVSTGVGAARLHYALFEGLVVLEGPDLRPSPGVASHWEVSGDGLRYTFHLRPQARWSNGEPVTAHDFVFSYRRMLTPGFGAENAYMLHELRGAEAFHNGSETDFATVGVKALADHTLELELHRPVPYFLSLLAHPSWYPVHPGTILRFGSAEQRGTRWTRPGNHVSNGPFQLEDWSLAAEIVLERNPHYWDADSVSLRTLRFFPIVNPNTEERAFRTGQLHVTYQVPLSRVAELLADQAPELRADPDLGTYYYAFNTRVPPLNDARVRQALSLAIDRQVIVEKIRQRGEAVARGFVPPGTAGYTGPGTVAENVAQARELLAQAGFPGGAGLPELELLYNESETHRLIAEAVQARWQEVLGVRISLRNMEWKALLEARRRGAFQILRAGWIGDYNDPQTFLGLWTGVSGNNHTGWQNATYDALLSAAGQSQDRAQRFELFREAEALLLAEAPLAPVFHYNRVYLLRPEVEGWLPNVLDYRRWQGISLAP